MFITYLLDNTLKRTGAISWKSNHFVPQLFPLVMEASKCCSDFLPLAVLFYWKQCDVHFTGPTAAESHWAGQDICSLVVVGQ